MVELEEQLNGEVSRFTYQETAGVLAVDILSPLRSLTKIFVLSVAAVSQDDAAETVDEDLDLMASLEFSRKAEKMPEVGSCGA